MINLRPNIIFGVCLMLLGELCFARAVDIFPAWQQKYPDSNSDALECQLCHAEATGGEPWNAYGWAIKEVLDSGSGLNFEEAFNFSQFDDHDSDPQSIESFDELLRSFQPGWTAGNVNTLYMADGTPIPNQPPPAMVAGTALDMPAPIADPIAGSIGVDPIVLDLLEMGDFESPVRAVTAPGITGSIFVVEKVGRVFRLDLTTKEKSLFLDVSAELIPGTLENPGVERGLLGLAFHPDYASNGLFYTYQSHPVLEIEDGLVDFSSLNANQTPDHRTKIIEHKASNASCNSNITERKTLLIIDQPQNNHNGGDLAFDATGNLYIALGDGGGANDQGPGHGLLGSGRNPENILGTILRINPLGANSANGHYGIPNSNPFVGTAGIDEIYAYGLRNPYAISFDSATGDLYAADVGQNNIEEVNQIELGGNYGWNWQEGNFYFYAPVSGDYVSTVAPPNLPPDLKPPLAEYDHDEGISVIGGYLYRGNTITGKNGSYIFGDFLRKIFSVDVSNGVITEFALATALNAFVTGFGQDADNEIYVMTTDLGIEAGDNGKLFKLFEAGDTPTPPLAFDESAQCPPEDLCFPIKMMDQKVAMVCI